MNQMNALIPNYKTYMVAFFTIVVREVIRFIRIWSQTLLPPVITVTLYFIIFGTLVGSQISAIKQFSYMQYIAPGLIMMTVITNAYSNVVGSFFGARFSRHVEEMIVAPVPRSVIVLGYVIGGVLRGVVVGGLVTTVAMFFSELHVAHLGITLLVILLSSALFSLAGFCNAIFARKFDDIAIVPTFILTPLTYLGGVFYSVNQLSSMWQGLSLFNPILYIVDAFRYGVLGIGDLSFSFSLLVMSACVVVLWSFCIYLLGRDIGLRM